MKRTRHSFADSVFFNCPFDKDYLPIFEAVVFAVVASGFRPRCAAESVDSGTVRLRKIEELIRGCKYGIHDLSRVELGQITGLPRFNMPFELGLDLAARAFGSGRLKTKQLLVLDSVPFRYQQFISDISGQDPRCHRGSPDTAIDIVRNWLRAASGHSDIPGPVTIKRLFERFVEWLPRKCADRGLSRDDLQYIDLVQMMDDWIRGEAAAAAPIDRAQLDPLTELRNRRAIDEIVFRELASVSAPAVGHAVLMLDIDGLKRINEQYGHLAGDRLLQKVAGILRTLTDGLHDVGRSGGDEFLVLVRSAHPAATTAFAERIRKKLAEDRVLVLPKVRVAVTASIGLVFLADSRGRSLSNLIAAAQSALLRAKANGGNQVARFQPPTQR